MPPASHALPSRQPVISSAEAGRSSFLIVFKSIGRLSSAFRNLDGSLVASCAPRTRRSRRSTQRQGNCNSVLGPGPGVMSVGHCLEPNGTSGGRNGVMPSLPDSATMASRALLPISS